MSDTDTVTFDYEVWIARYPEFALTTPELGQALFNEALFFLSPSVPPVVDKTERAILLGMLTAHLAQLRALSGGQAGGSGVALTGPIASVSQGSVSISVQPLGTGTGAMQAWLSQTQYGAQYWAMTAGYRTARYIQRPRPYLGVGPRMSGNWW